MIKRTTGCCIAGGGPAGLMLGFLLARAGVDVVVLEKHADFFRDFRGDTIHPSTLELMHELGLLSEFLCFRQGLVDVEVSDLHHLGPESAADGDPLAAHPGAVANGVRRIEARSQIAAS